MNKEQILKKYPADSGHYGYFEGGCNVHEWLEELGNKKCPRMLTEIGGSGKIDTIIEKLMEPLSYINYRYDTLTEMVLDEAKKQGLNIHQLYELTLNDVKKIKINYQQIPPHKWKRMSYNDIDDIFDKIYQFITEKIKCPNITKNDIKMIKLKTKRQYIKQFNQHPYIMYRNKLK